MGGTLGKLGSNTAVTKVLGGMNLSSVMQGALGTIADSGDQRAAFNAVLLATAANSMKKPNFNLELEMNDLYIRLGNLRGMESSSARGGAMKLISNAAHGVLGPLESALQALAKTTKP